MKHHFLRQLTGALLGATLLVLGGCTSLPIDTAAYEPPTHDYIGGSD